MASLAWDPEPSGALGGDQAPNNIAAIAPVIDNRTLLTIDANGDGVPDAIDRTAPALTSAVATGNDSVVVLQFSEPLLAATANQASRYSMYQTGNPTATLTVKSATLQPGGTQVRLVVAHMSYVPYTVVAIGIADASCFQNVAGLLSAAFQGPPVSVDPRAALPRVLELSPPWPNPNRDGRVNVEYRLPAGAGAGLPVSAAGACARWWTARSFRARTNWCSRAGTTRAAVLHRAFTSCESPAALRSRRVGWS